MSSVVAAASGARAHQATDFFALWADWERTTGGENSDPPFWAYVWPAARASYDGIAKAPDFVLVEYNDGDEQVRVEKQGHKLVVEVDSDGEQVHVELPLRLVERVLEKLEGS